MRKYFVRVYSPRYYEVKAVSAKKAQAKAVALFDKDQSAEREPTVEILMEDGVLTGFWDVVDAQIDEYQDRGL